MEGERGLGAGGWLELRKELRGFKILFCGMAWFFSTPNSLPTIITFYPSSPVIFVLALKAPAVDLLKLNTTFYPPSFLYEAESPPWEFHEHANFCWGFKLCFQKDDISCKPIYTHQRRVIVSNGKPAHCHAGGQNLCLKKILHNLTRSHIDQFVMGTWKIYAINYTASSDML